MKLSKKHVDIGNLAPGIKSWTSQGSRLGLLTSIDGDQLISVLLHPSTGELEIWESPISNSQYSSLTASIPQAHWFERTNWDLFGITPLNHPRLKPLLLHDRYENDFFPLRNSSSKAVPTARTGKYEFLEVKGEGVFELPVGPIHAGVIEPGHFRFSCRGETIVNLELQLGWLHRGVEKRVTEVPWRKARFVAEAASSDTAVGNSLAHAIAIESLFDIEAPEAAQYLRTIALEIERAAMHIIDIGGAANDVGFLGVIATLGRLRGKALGIGQTLTGSRLQRAYIVPGGVQFDNRDKLESIHDAAKSLIEDLKPIIQIYQENQTAIERMEGIGRISKSLATEFGFVGVTGRACGIEYDTRQHFRQGVYPKLAPPIAIERGGDILSRTRIRIEELWRSLNVICELSQNVPSGPVTIELPDELPKDSIGVGIVEAFRGEMIHLAITDDAGKIKRYAIKDPSVNNWTAISIAIRSNLIADFPLCNKSLALSYSGNDL